MRWDKYSEPEPEPETEPEPDILTAEDAEVRREKKGSRQECWDFVDFKYNPYPVNPVNPV